MVQTAKTSASDRVVIEAFAKLDQTALGLAVGTLSGLGVFIATVVLLIKGGEVVGPRLALLGQFFIGYTVTAEWRFNRSGLRVPRGLYHWLVNWLLQKFASVCLPARVKNQSKSDFLSGFNRLKSVNDSLT